MANVIAAPKIVAGSRHYRIVCISLYTAYIEKLEHLVAEMQRRGFTKANKSWLIRVALDQLDLDKIERGTP